MSIWVINLDVCLLYPYSPSYVRVSKGQVGQYVMENKNGEDCATMESDMGRDERPNVHEICLFCRFCISGYRKIHIRAYFREVFSLKTQTRNWGF